MQKYVFITNHIIIYNKKASYTLAIFVRVKGVEPPRLAALDPKSSASTNSAIPALKDKYIVFTYIR